MTSLPFARALLAPAVVAAAIALSGCDQGQVPSGRALAPLSDKLIAEIANKNMDKNSPILIRLFKEEAELEVWKMDRDGQYALLKTYPICRWSGDLGPKKKEGDRQAPEGFYTITPAQMNPNSNYYLAFNTGYPNTYDRVHGYTGSELMVHGDCSSRGCYAMTDEQIQEIYALARDSFFGGQKEFQFEAFPFRMTALNMAKHRNNKNISFWKMLKEGYDDFEATHQEPKVAVCDMRYVFDAAPPANSTRPLRFNPRGKCPSYQLDPAVASTVLNYRRQQQFKMANYIAENVPLAPPHVGDGGMNPVFANQIASRTEYDGNGHLVKVADLPEAPGALPHVPNPPGAFAALHPPKNRPKPQVATQQAPAPASAAPDSAAPTVMANVPMPEVAPLPKEGEASPQRPTTIAGLLGNLFGGAPPAAKPAAPETAADSGPLALRGSTEATAKPKPAATFRTASASAIPRRKPHETVKPKAVTALPKAAPKVAAKPAPARRAVAAAPEAAPPAKAHLAAAQKSEPAPQKELRTASSTPAASTNGLMAGAQPVVPVGSFDNRWAGLP